MLLSGRRGDRHQPVAGPIAFAAKETPVDEGATETRGVAERVEPFKQVVDLALSVESASLHSFGQEREGEELESSPSGKGPEPPKVVKKRSQGRVAGPGAGLTEGVRCGHPAF